MKRIAIISADATNIMVKRLKHLDIEPITVPKTDLVSKYISGHPDIQIFPYRNKIFCQPDISKSFLKRIEKFTEIIICESRLRAKHPGDIAYNIAFTGQAVFHKLEYTDKTIMDHLKSQKIKIIDVKQGYSKCSTLIIDNNTIITSDNSIHTCTQSKSIDSLLISTGHIDLPGYKYGFIGGASGKVDNYIIFTGTFTHHPDYDRIMEFIEKSGKTAYFLSDERIIDLGSVFFI